MKKDLEVRTGVVVRLYGPNAGAERKRFVNFEEKSIQ